MLILAEKFHHAQLGEGNTLKEKRAVHDLKFSRLQEKIKQGLIGTREAEAENQMLIIEGIALDNLEKQQKIQNALALADAIMQTANAYNAAEQAALNKEKAIALGAADSIKWEKKRQKEIDRINQEFEKKQDDLNKKSKRAKRTQTVINNAVAIMEVWADKEAPLWSKIIMSALVAAAGQQQLKTIDATKYAQGGYVGGRRHSQGGTMIEAERGEYVVSRRGVDAIGLEALNRINAGAGGGSVNISFSGNVLSKDFIEDEAIPQIKEAIRRGADIGIG